MKTNKLIKIFLSLFLLIGVATSCVQDNEFDTPQITCNEPEVTVNATIADVKALYKGSLQQITEDLVIEGYVVSNDEAGNFYRTLHFQDALENPTQGLQLDVDLQDMYTKYPVGKKIYLKIKGLYIDNYRGVIKLGGKYQLPNGNFAVGRLSATEITDKLFRACDQAQTVTPTVTTLAELSDNMINTLIKFEKMQVAPESLCQNYAEKAKNTNVYLEDCNGKKIILRNSGYSTFYNQKLPLGSGTITAVLGKYGKDYQLTIRDAKDLEMNEVRCDGSTFTCEAPEVNATIQQVKDLYQTEKVKITESLVFNATITADDASKNFYKNIYVQDETGAIKININLTGLSSRGYKIGQKVIVSTKDLYVNKVNGELALGKPYTDKNGKERFGGIDAVYGRLYLQEENKPIKPTVITELKEENIGKLVQLDAVQFIDTNVTFADDKRSGNREISTCDGKLKLLVRTSSYATFGKENVPKKNGSIVGILTKYNTTYQLYLRNKEDYSAMTGERCKVASQAVLKNIIDIRKIFKGTKTAITEDVKIKAVITSDANTKNINSQNAFVQDNSGGIALRFNANPNLALGEEVEIALKGVELSEYNGLLQLNRIPLDNIKSKKAGTLPTPEVITLEQALSGNYQGKLVSISNVQFKDNTKNYEGNNVLTNCTKELKSFVSNRATFATDKVNAKKGIITGVMTSFKEPQLYIRNISDINFTENYTACDGTNGGGDNSGNTGGTTGKKLLFPGADFEDWNAFKGMLNKYGLKNYATQSNNGRNNSKALLIKGKPTRNDYVFTATVPEGFKASGKTKITFYIKGKVTGKSLSINIHNAEGKYKPFNLGDYTKEAVVQPASNNQYSGTIDTGGKWLKVTLNIAEIVLPTQKGKNLFALKVGRGVDWDILVDDITIE